MSRPKRPRVLLLATLLAAACAEPLAPPLSRDAAGARRGEVASIERVAGYPALFAKGLVWWAGLSERLPIEHGVTLYRVGYWTLGEHDALVRASGLVAFPRTDRLRGVVGYQHGTAVARSSAPSAPSPGEGVVASLAFAGRGYLLLAPDYVGLGRSQERHPYYVTDVAVANTIDLIRAARRMVEARGWVWPDTLLLAGFSQGGHVTIAALRALERNPEPGLRVAAAAPIAGPYDLSGSSFPRALEGEATHSSLYLAYLVSSYARAYGEPIDTVLRPPWDEAAPALFDGEHEAREVMEALPRDPKDLFREDFLDATAAGRPTWLGERLRENDLVDFTPRAPVRLYYGRLDVDVSPEEARRQSRRWRDRGADATAVDVGALDHDGSAIEAAVRIREWFDELTAGAASEQP